MMKTIANYKQKQTSSRKCMGKQEIKKGWLMGRNIQPDRRKKALCLTDLQGDYNLQESVLYFKIVRRD